MPWRFLKGLEESILAIRHEERESPRVIERQRDLAGLAGPLFRLSPAAAGGLLMVSTEASLGGAREDLEPTGGVASRGHALHVSAQARRRGPGPIWGDLPHVPQAAVRSPSEELQTTVLIGAKREPIHGDVEG